MVTNTCKIMFNGIYIMYFCLRVHFSVITAFATVPKPLKLVSSKILGICISRTNKETNLK